MAPRSSGRSRVLGASVRGARPRAGQPYMRKYDDGRMFARFTAISRSLRGSGFKQELVTERELSRLTGRLLAFCDAALGRDSNPEARAGLTKLPARLFFDYGPKGSLRVILKTCLRFSAEKGWPGLDLRESSRRDEHLAMLHACERALRAEKMMSVAMVYFSARLSNAEVQKLRTFVQAHGGAVVSTPDVASHVVYPDPPGRSEAESDGQVMVRLLKREGKPGGVRALVHWYYHPDTYDDWIMAREVRGHVEPDLPERGGAPWHVGARFLRDLDVFNEWMNEVDYEMPHEFAAYEGRRPPFVVKAQAVQRGAAGGEGRSVRIRLRMSDDESLGPSAKRMRAASDGVKLVGLPSIGGSSGNGGARSGGETLERQRAAERDAAPRRSLRAAGRQPMDAVEKEEAKVADERRPRYADWFDMKRVHDIERNALPEFFSGRYLSKNERVYVEMRNFMIQTWARSPIRYLSATAARRNLRGDAPAIQRIHAFLEHWGLINFNVLPETRSQQIHVPPPPPLPVLAGRVDSASGRRRSVLFLEDGSPVDIHEGRVRRVNLDGTPVFVDDETASDATKSGLLVGTGVTDNSINPLLTPGAVAGGSASAFQTTNGIHPGTEADGGMMSDQRPVRSTRYSSRQRRVSRYVDHSSDDDDINDDDDDDDEDDEEDASKEIGGDGKADGTDGNEDGERDADTVEYHCDICTKDCTNVRYHCTQHADMDVCTDCYTEQKYPSSLQPRDFIQMSAAPAGPDDVGAANDPLVWSESENLLLLEALEMYGENWVMVAEHVDSKSAAQCILQLLRLPVEDSFLDEVRESWWANNNVVRTGVGASGSTPKEGAPSPSDVLLRCGAKPGALQRVFEVPSSLTGQSLPFSDPIETIVPQVALLGSQVPRNVLASIMKDVGRASRQRSEDTRLNEQASKSLGDDANVDEFVTDLLYRQRHDSIPAVSEYAEMDCGTRAASIALEELRRGREKIAAPVREAAFQPKTTSSSQAEGLRERNGDESSYESGKLQFDDVDDLASTDTESTQAIATMAMACGAMRAKEVLELEEKELERTQALLFELKLAMIHKKIEHLTTICHHHRVSQLASVRQRQDAFGATCLLKGSVLKGHLCEGNERIFVMLSGPTASKAKANDSAPARRARTSADAEFTDPTPGACLIRTALTAPQPYQAPPSRPVPSAPRTNYIQLGQPSGQAHSSPGVAPMSKVYSQPIPRLATPSAVGVAVNSTAVIDGSITGLVTPMGANVVPDPDARGPPNLQRDLTGKGSYSMPNGQAAHQRPLSEPESGHVRNVGEPAGNNILFDASTMVRKSHAAPVDTKRTFAAARLTNASAGCTPNTVDANGRSVSADLAMTPSVQSKHLVITEDDRVERTASGNANASLTPNGRL